MTERSGWPHRIALVALAVTSAALPLYVVRFRVGPLPTTLLENFIGVTVAAYAANLWSERRWPAARTSIDIPIALLLLAGIVGIVVAPDHTRALGIYRAYFIEAVAMFYVAIDLIRTRKDLRTVILISGAGWTLFALGQIVTFLIALAHHDVHVDAAPAFLNTSANSVALYLEPPLALALGFVLFSSNRRDRWLTAICLVVILTAAILTLSRAAYAALSVLAAIAVFTLPNWRIRFGAVAMLVVLALLVVELPFVSERLGTFSHSVQLRLSIYGEALRMLSQRPVFGAGISGFPIRVAPYRPAAQEIELYPHNIWLTTWSELGLLGLVSFGVIFFGLLWQGWRALGAADGIYRAVIWGGVGALVLYLVHGMFDSPYWKNDLSVEFWILAALIVAAVRGSKTDSPGSRPGN